MSTLNVQLNVEAPCFPIEMPTNHRTWQNLYATHCGMCGKLLYVEQVTLQGITYATQSGLDNPLRCERCVTEYDDLAYEG